MAEPPREVAARRIGSWGGSFPGGRGRGVRWGTLCESFLCVPGGSVLCAAALPVQADTVLPAAAVLFR